MYGWYGSKHTRMFSLISKEQQHYGLRMDCTRRMFTSGSGLVTRMGCMYNELVKGNWKKRTLSLW